MNKREKELQIMEQLHATQIETRDRDIERLGQENLRLAQRVEALERQEASVLQAIMQARETAAGTVDAAKKRAQEIYSDAVDVTASARNISENARSIIAQAEEKAAEILKDAHDSSTRIIAKANERSAFIQNEARIMLEEYQSLMNNARSRLHSMMLSNIENMRDFASKLTVLYADGIPDDLEPLLAESVREIELHLKQIGSPSPTERQPAIGYTDAQELVKAIHRMQGRSIPDIANVPNAPSVPSVPNVPDNPHFSDILDVGVVAWDSEDDVDDEPDEERVWTVDEVMRANKEFPPDRSLDYETDEGLAHPYAHAQQQQRGATGIPYPYAPEKEPYGASNVDQFEGLNLRNTGHSDLKASTGEYEKSAPVLRPQKDEAFDGLVMMGQSSKLETTPRETAFEGLNLREGGHSIISADLGAFESFGAEAGIAQPSPIKRTKEHEPLPDGFSLN